MVLNLEREEVAVEGSDVEHFVVAPEPQTRIKGYEVTPINDTDSSILRIWLLPPPDQQAIYYTTVYVRSIAEGAINTQLHDQLQFANEADFAKEPIVDFLVTNALLARVGEIEIVAATTNRSTFDRTTHTIPLL